MNDAFKQHGAFSWSELLADNVELAIGFTLQRAYLIVQIGVRLIPGLPEVKAPVYT